MTDREALTEVGPRRVTCSGQLVRGPEVSIAEPGLTGSFFSLF